MNMATDDLAARIRAIEDRQAIAELPARYAMAVDGRDLDQLCALFVDDVPFGRHGAGPIGARSHFKEALSGFTRSVHLLAGQMIDAIEGDRATGRVYCRAEHEVGDDWIVAAICYTDQYERRGGRWLFARRKPQLWYATDWARRPCGPDWFSWPGKTSGSATAAELPQAFPTWERFWSDCGRPMR